MEKSILSNLGSDREAYEAKVRYNNRALRLIDMELARLLGDKMIVECHICHQKTTLGQLNPFQGCEKCRGK